jgi:hypothetical protein
VSYAHSLQIYGPGHGVFGWSVIPANADPASTSAAGTVAYGVSSSQSQGRGLPLSTATPVPNSATLPETKQYQVPPDFDANGNLHPTPAVSADAQMSRATQPDKKLPRATTISGRSP